MLILLTNFVKLFDISKIFKKKQKCLCAFLVPDYIIKSSTIQLSSQPASIGSHWPGALGTPRLGSSTPALPPPTWRVPWLCFVHPCAPRIPREPQKHINIKKFGKFWNLKNLHISWKSKIFFKKNKKFMFMCLFGSWIRDVSEGNYFICVFFLKHLAIVWSVVGVCLCFDESQSSVHETVLLRRSFCYRYCFQPK